jgi:hypothetical protein
MDRFSPYGGAPHVVGPGSLAPQISDLGTMMDTLVQQRAHLAQIQRQQDAEDRQSAALAEKEAYGRRKQDLIEAKQNTQDRFGRAKFNQDALAKVTQGVGSGKGAGPTLFQGPNGEPSMVNFKYGVPVSRMPDPFDPQSAAAPMAAPPPAAAAPAPSPAPQAQPDVGNLPPMMQTPFVLASQRKLPIPPVASAMPDGRSMVQQPELERLMAQSHGQAAPPLGNSVFLDETDDGQARALMGPQETQVKNLPLDAFPEGAKEGQRFNADDVNMTGGKGNPFASALPGQPPPEPQQQPPGPAPRSSSMMVPGQQIRGMSAQMPQDQGGVWEGDIPGMGHVSIDPAEARAAHLDDVKQKVQQAEAMMSDPTTPREMIPLLARERVTMLAQLDPQDRRLLLGQTGAMDLDTQKGGRQQEMQDDRLSAQKDIADSRNATAIKAAEMRKKGGKGGGSARSGDPTAGADNPWAKLPYKQRNSEGNRIDRETRDWATQQGWTKLLGSNLGRVEWASKNIHQEGEYAGGAHMAAMFNIFGAERNGVPVENETKQFFNATRSLRTMLDDLGPSIGLPQLGTRLANGELTGPEAEKYKGAVSSMPTDRRIAIEKMVSNAGEALTAYGVQRLKNLRVKYDNEPLANRYKITADLNSLAGHLGLEPRQWWKDVPLRSSSADSAPLSDSGSAQPSSGTSTAPGGASGALENAVQQLLKRKNAAPGN